LGRLAEGADQDEHHGGPASRRLQGGQRYPVHQFGNPVGARLPTQDEQTGQHNQAGESGDQQGLTRSHPGSALIVQEADEQERRHPGELPERKQKQHMVGQHGAQHGGHKQDEVGVEPPMVLVVPIQVAGGVKHNQRAHAGHNQGKEKRKSIHPESQFHPQRRHPRPTHGEIGLRPGQHRHPEQQGGTQRWKQQGQPAGVATELAPRQRGKHVPDQRQHDRP
jgi:hypothetical protein